MSITNESKPNTAVPETYLNVGSGFNLLVGSTFKLIIGALGLGGMTNISKVSQGETWGTIASTWATEDETWGGSSQLFTNVSVAFDLWSYRTTPWLLSSPWLTTTNPFINVAKP